MDEDEDDEDAKEIDFDQVNERSGFEVLGDESTPLNGSGLGTQGVSVLRPVVARHNSTLLNQSSQLNKSSIGSVPSETRENSPSPVSKNPSH